MTPSLSVAAQGGRPAARPRVTAVLVVHDGARWLPRTLAALAGSDRRPDVVVAVDAGSRDSSPTLLDAALLAAPVAGDRRVVDAVVRVPREAAFGQSVQRARETAAELVAAGHGAASGDGAPWGEGPEWVWLLHDDSAPEPDALDQLLAAVAAAPTIAVAGCKQRGWDDADLLVEAGATVTPGGRRLTEVTPGDLDQGQLDGRGDVLVVSTAGMLVRADVLDELRGLDPALPLVGDDVDLCVRARRAGHRVSVVPTAVVRHAAALERGQREATALRGRMGRGLGASAPRAGGPRGGLTCARRAHWLHTRLAQSPLLLVPLLLLWVVLAAPVRSAVWLVRRRPGTAWAELAAVAHLLAHLHLVVRTRWRSRRTRAVPSSALRPLRPTRAQVVRDEVDAYRVRRALARRPDDGDDEHVVPLEALESGPVDDDLIDLDLGAGGPLKQVLRHPLTYLVPLVAVLGVVPWLRVLLAPPAPVVEGEAPGGPGAGELWARALTDWRDVGVGAPAPADPAAAVWAGLTSTVSLLAGDGWAGADLASARTWVLVLAPLLSLLTGWLAARAVVRRRLPAAALAATWGVLPATGLLGGVHAGTLLVHVLLPLLALSLTACLGRRPLRATAATALLGTLVVALSPSTWPPLVLAAVVVGALGGWRARASWRAVLPVVGSLLPAPLLAPWAVLLAAAPRLVLVDPVAADPSAVALPTLVDLAPRARAALDPAVGAPSVADVSLVVVTGAAAVAVVLAALLFVLSLSRARVAAARAAFGVAVAALLTGALAVWQAGLTPSVPASAAALAGLFVVALLLRDLHDPDRAPARHDTPARRRAWWCAAVAGVAVPAGVLAAAVAVAVLGPVPAPTTGLPAAALVGSGSELATRTLVITSAGADGASGAGGAGAPAGAGTTDEPVPPPVVTWATTSGQPGPGQDSVARLVLDGVDRAGDARLAGAVETLLGGQGRPAGAVAASLAQAGVGWVVVTGPEALDTAVAQRSGLVRTAVADGRSTWRVDAAAVRDTGSAEPARARVEGGDGTVVPLPVERGQAVVPPGEDGRVLVLAENAHPGWAATLDGAELAPARVDRWAQGFELPAEGGTVQLREPRVRPDAVLLSGGAALAVGLLLLWPLRTRAAYGWQGRQPLPRQARRTRVLAPRAGRAATAGVALVVVAALVVVTTGTLSQQAARQAAAAAAVLQERGGPAAAVAGALGDAVDSVAGRRATASDPVVGAPLVALASPGTEQACDEATVVPRGDADVVRGLEAALARSGDERGLTLAACPLSATTSWVLLGGTDVEERPAVEVTATGETPALVDVAVGSVDGPVDTPAATGLLVPAGGSTTVAVDSLAPDLPAVLVRVTARAGAVAVTGSDRGLEGLVPRGRDTVPAQTTPSETAVLPTVVVPDGPGAVSRLLLAPAGAVAAVTQVEVSGPDGPVDLGTDAVSVVPGGGVGVVDLARLPPGRYAVHIRADAPVLAAATWEQRRAGGPVEGLTGVPSDRAWVQAVSPVAADGVEVALDDLTEVGALGGTRVDVVGAAGEPVRGSVELLATDGDVLVSRRLQGPAGLGTSELLGDLVQAAAEAAGDDGPAEAAVLRIVPDGTPLHVALRAVVDDEDGQLLAATSLPGASPAPLVVRLVGVPLPVLDAPAAAARHWQPRGPVVQPGS